MDPSLLADPKIDCHVHVFDPARFPYRPDTHYAPTGHELGTPAHLDRMLDAYGVRHALLVQPNSGYDTDNACMLDTIARSAGRCKGIAVVRNDVTIEELQRLKAEGVVGVAWNVLHVGVEHCLQGGPLLQKLAALDMFMDIGFEHDQLAEIWPVIEPSTCPLLVDHCGRPDLGAGPSAPGFAALLALGRSGRAHVKLSGYVKFSREPPPHRDAWPAIAALVEAFTIERCLWATDWPFLRAPSRVDYGVLLSTAVELFPDPERRRMLFWDNPRRLFGFDRTAL